MEHMIFLFSLPMMQLPPARPRLQVFVDIEKQGSTESFFEEEQWISVVLNSFQTLIQEDSDFNAMLLLI